VVAIWIPSKNAGIPPVHKDRLYNVFRFGTELSISIYGNQIRLPAPVSGNKCCVIVDFCQDSGGTVFFMLPQESRNMLDNFFFSNLSPTNMVCDLGHMDLDCR
jgi:hypothetical protein